MRDASEITQGNTCVNVLDFAPDGQVAVRALNMQEHLAGTGLQRKLAGS